MALTASDVVGSLGRWRSVVKGQLERILDTAIATKESAASVAQRFRDYASPLFSPRRGIDGRLIQREIVGSWPGMPGAASAGPRLLLVSGTGDAYRESVIATASGLPQTGILWLLSPEHSRPDACDRISNRNNGYGRGVYLPADLPDRPHPRCVCVQCMVPLIAARSVA